MTAPPVITRVSQLSTQLCIQKTKQLVLSFLKLKWLNKAKQSRSMKTLSVEGSDKVVVLHSQPANVKHFEQIFSLSKKEEHGSGPFSRKSKLKEKITPEHKRQIILPGTKEEDLRTYTANNLNVFLRWSRIKLQPYV